MVVACSSPFSVYLYSVPSQTLDLLITVVIFLVRVPASLYRDWNIQATCLPPSIFLVHGIALFVKLSSITLQRHKFRQRDS